jgi:hypothetical protein
MDNIPHLFFDTVLRDQKKHKLAHYERLNISPIMGSYGILQRYNRIDLSGNIINIIVKKPKFGATSAFYHEALLQRHVQMTLQKSGHGSAIPRVIDIFIDNENTCFSMDFIHGSNSLIYCLHSDNFHTVWLQILFQVSLLLAFLQETICFDHRDLKFNNVWIRDIPVTFFMLGWKFKCPFEVVILDFGFACLGNRNRETVINLGEGVFTQNDKCPKEGRDLFQFILSFWSNKMFREKCSADLEKFIESLLSKFSTIAKNLNSFDWSYLLTRDREFSVPQLEPGAVLQKIFEDYPYIILRPPSSFVSMYL